MCRDMHVLTCTCPETCNSLNFYLQCFRLPNLVMQTSQTISYAMEQLVKRLDQQGLVYAEKAVLKARVGL